MPNRKTAKRQGHPTTFSAEQNRLLRSALRDLQRDRALSQADLGALLGVSQQIAGKLLLSPRAGMSYGTASSLARALGFAGVDDFFAQSVTTHVARSA